MHYSMDTTYGGEQESLVVNIRIIVVIDSDQTLLNRIDDAHLAG